MKLFFKNEEGAVIVLIALCMTIFMGIMVIVIDVGSLYLEKARLQKIVDAAALAGAQDLTNHETSALQEVQKIIQFHDEEPTYFNTIITANNTMIEVVGNKQGTLFFANVLGITEPNIHARAVVQLLSINSVGGAIPLGVPSTIGLAFGDRQVLKVTDGSQGNFGALALSGSGASSFEMDLTNGYSSNLKIGAVINTERGQMAGPTERAVNSRISKCPNATFNNYPENCPRVVTVPVFDPIIEGNQIRRVVVVGFATFFLESVGSTSQGADITGRFIRVTQTGETGPALHNFGTYGLRLIE